MLAATKQRLDACHNFKRIERLGHIVVRTLNQALNLIQIVGFGRKHQYRNLTVLSDFSDDCKAIHLRHHDVKNHQADVRIRIEFRNGLFSVIGAFHFVAFVFDINTEQFNNILIIINNQNFHSI